MSIASFEDALARAGVTDATLDPALAQALDQDGYLLLRGAIPADWLAPLQAKFEEKLLANDRWPAPRGPGARHSMLLQDADAHRVCLLPILLSCAHHILRRRFFLADVQGRDPGQGGGQQTIHRDWPEPAGPAPLVIALAFLDDFGPDNGATRVLAGTHREDGGADAFSSAGDWHPRQTIIAGNAGDILLMDGYLAHSGMRNNSGAPRRNLQICYRGAETYDERDARRDLGDLSPLGRYMTGRDLTPLPIPSLLFSY